MRGKRRSSRKTAPPERSASAAARPSGPSRPSNTSPFEWATMNHGGMLGREQRAHHRTGRRADDVVGAAGVPAGLARERFEAAGEPRAAHDAARAQYESDLHPRMNTGAPTGTSRIRNWRSASVARRQPLDAAWPIVSGLIRAVNGDAVAAGPAGREVRLAGGEGDDAAAVGADGEAVGRELVGDLEAAGRRGRAGAADADRDLAHELAGAADADPRLGERDVERRAGCGSGRARQDRSGSSRSRRWRRPGCGRRASGGGRAPSRSRACAAHRTAS